MDLYQQVIYKSRYCRWDETKKRRENWDEVVDRYINYFKNKIKNSDQIDWVELREAIYTLEVMPSMRSLMTSGKALERDNVANFNCSYLVVDSPRAFDELMYILCCFHPDTLIKTKKGDKKISEISDLDEVLSYDAEKNIYEFIKPERVLENSTENKEKMELEFEDGSKIVCTSDHLFLTARGYIQAKDLNESDIFVE